MRRKVTRPKQQPTLPKACSEMTMAELEAAAAISDREYSDDLFEEASESQPSSPRDKKKPRRKPS